MFFGSFNPIHLGHLAVAEYMLKELQLEKILFIISPLNPFKQSADLWTPEKRLMLVQKAINYNPQLEASDIEFSLPQPSYTYITLEKLKNLYPDTKFAIIVGSDNLLRLKEWKEIETILGENTFEVFQRSGTEHLQPFHPNIHIHKSPFVDVSATEIRQKLVEGKSVAGLVPDSIIELM